MLLRGFFSPFLSAYSPMESEGYNEIYIYMLNDK